MDLAPMAANLKLKLGATGRFTRVKSIQKEELGWDESFGLAMY